jgi:hypothetical protein
MNSLFLKIFLSFWMAFALFLVLAILVTMAFRPRSSSWEGVLATALNDSVNAYEQRGKSGLREYLDNLESTQHVRVFLFNENMEEVSHRGAPEWAVRVATGGPRVPHEGFIFPAPPPVYAIRALPPMDCTGTRWFYHLRRALASSWGRAACPFPV